MGYYDGTKLLSQKDINGNDPEIYISCTNRSAGKTTFYNRMLLNRYLKGKGQFYLITRQQLEIDSISSSFFGGVAQFFPGHEMTQKQIGKGKFASLFFDDEPCGFAIPLTATEYCKKVSHLFEKVTFGVFDEFQSETNAYLSHEVDRFVSLHQSIARGGGAMSRRVPVVMISNMASVLNPYYRALGIRSQDITGSDYYRGDGFVLERRTVQAAADALRAQAFNRAFSHGDSQYAAAMTGDGELLDNTRFVQKSAPQGNAVYIATLHAYGKAYGIRYYTMEQVIYVTEKSDLSASRQVTAQPEYMSPDVHYIQTYRDIYYMIKTYYNLGKMRFDSLASKDAVGTVIMTC